MQQAYNALINSNLTSTEISGRYNFMNIEEKNSINNVINLIEVNPNDNILDIGSNDGKMTIPLSYLSKSVTCVDSVDLNNFIKQKKISNINFYSGNFINLEINDKFDKIIVYSVLHCLKSDDLYKFIDKCLELLNVNGILLFGDIPNIDKKQRYLEKYQTETERLEWEKIMKQNKENIDKQSEYLKNIKNVDLVTFNDDNIFELIKYIRKKGFNCYIQNQADGLPYNKTREDIIVRNYC